MSPRFVIGGLRFFAVSLVLGVALFLVAPLDVIRAFCALAIAGAAAGCALHLAVLRGVNPDAFHGLQQHFAAALRSGSSALLSLGKSLSVAAKDAWTRGVHSRMPDHVQPRASLATRATQSPSGERPS